MIHFDYDAASDGVSPAVMREAVVMQMTWPGAPTIYYGDEAGVCGFTDPDNRRTYPWGKEDQEMLEFHRAAVRLHKKYPLLSKGSLKFLHGAYNCLAYGRFDEEEQIVVVFNNNAEEKDMVVRVWPAGVSMEQSMTRIFCTNAEGFSEQPEVYPVTRGELHLHMHPLCAMVLRAVQEGPDCRRKLKGQEVPETAEKSSVVSETAEKSPVVSETVEKSSVVSETVEKSPVVSETSEKSSPEWIERREDVLNAEKVSDEEDLHTGQASEEGGLNAEKAPVKEA